MNRSVDDQLTRPILDAYWQAIEHNDVSFDGVFYYAVTTTGIVCRPSCKSRLPRKEHVRVFMEVSEAVREGYRPCKRCTPDARQSPDVQLVERMSHWLDLHDATPVTLEALAAQFHGSPYHLQRTFKRIMGVTPLQYIQRARISAAKKALHDKTRSLAAIADDVGLANAAYLSTLFQRHTGLTPTQYRQTASAHEQADLKRRSDEHA